MRREYANLKTEKKHKLSPIADGAYLVISVQETTVVLEIDGEHERNSLDRVVEAPSPPRYVIEHDRDITTREDAQTGVNAAQGAEASAPNGPDGSTERSPSPLLEGNPTGTSGGKDGNMDFAIRPPWIQQPGTLP